jgi:hypothetical protein
MIKKRPKSKSGVTHRRFSGVIGSSDRAGPAGTSVFFRKLPLMMIMINIMKINNCA